MADDQIPGAHELVGDPQINVNDCDELEVFSWGPDGLDVRPLHDRAPSWSPLHTMSDRLHLRRGTDTRAVVRMEHSKRWFLAQREVPIPVDDEGDPLDEFAIGEGDLICFLDNPYNDGTVHLSAPARVMWVCDGHEPGAQQITTLLDANLCIKNIDYVPFPLDAEAMCGEWSLVTGQVRRALLNLWSLDVTCPRCGSVSETKVLAGDGYQIGQYKCRTCRKKWPEDLPVDLMADPEVHGQFAWWTTPVTDALAPMVEAGWVFAPFELHWDWKTSVELRTRLIRGDDAIVVTFNPQDFSARLLGPIDLGPEGTVLDTALGPARARAVLSEVTDLMEAQA